MKKGFTLIELLVVVLIIGVLSAIALPQYTTAVEKARATEALSLLGSIRYAAERTRLQTRKWPVDFNSLDIEVPGTLEGTGTTFYTKNFKFSAQGAGSNTSSYTISASRANNGTALTGDSGYTLSVTVKSDGTSRRYCSGSANLCKSISSGKCTGSNSTSCDF